MKNTFVLLIAIVCLCSCSRTDAIVVGSKNFTEQVILGEIAAQQIERKLHLRVERKLNLGGTLLAHQALVKGDIDLYPEYTGTGFNDTFAMVARTADVQKLRSAKLSAAESRSWRLGVGYEFLTRPDGLRKLDEVYRLRWEGTPRSMDLGLLYRALKGHNVDMAAADSTDASLTDPSFTVLEDDRKAFPPYNACFVLRKSLVDQKPDVGMALTMLSNHINAETMRGLNRRVEVDHQPVERVAKDFLETQP
jgi:osmoprotectant transport system substrate-binding protein